MPQQPSAAPQGATGVITAAERAALVNELEQSRKRFLDAVRGLSEKQSVFSSEAGRWSIQNCAEHLAIFEDTFRSMVQDQLLRSPAASEKSAAARQMDPMLGPGVRDRSQRTKTAPFLEPTGKFADVGRAAAKFEESRKETVDYARNTNDPLRVHFAPAPTGELDGYQWLLVIAAHTDRHTAQIEEIKKHAKYPK